MECDWKAWSITPILDPRFVKGILGCLMIKTVVPHLDLDCFSVYRENSVLIKLTFFPFHFFMEQKSPVTLIVILICFALQANIIHTTLIS